MMLRILEINFIQFIHHKAWQLWKDASMSIGPFLPSLSNRVAFSVRALLAAIAFAPSESGMLNDSGAQMVYLSRGLDLIRYAGSASSRKLFMIWKNVLFIVTPSPSRKNIRIARRLLAWRRAPIA